MAEKTPEQVREAILDKLEKAENVLATAKDLHQRMPTGRTPGHIRQATTKRDNLKQMLSDHDAKQPRPQKAP